MDMPRRTKDVVTAEGALRQPLRADRLAWILIALTPVVFGLATWDPESERSGFQSLMRFLALPVLTVELVVIGFALGSGFRPFRLLAAMPMWIRIALAALVAVAFGSAVFVALSPNYALIRTCIWTIHLLFGLGAAHLLVSSSPKSRLVLWRLVVAGMLLYLLLVTAFIVAIPDPETFEWVYFGLGVIHVRQLGFYSLVGAAAALGLAAAERGRSGYWLAVGAATLMLALSFWSGTRGSPIALLAALAVGGALLPGLRTVRTLGAALISFIGGAFVSFIHSVPNQFFGLVRISSSASGATVDEVGSGRVTMWLGTLRAVLERPLFGYGDSQFNRIVPEALGIYNHPHNALLQILFQWGFVGGACFFAIALALCWRALRNAQASGTAHAPAFLVAASLLVMALYEGSLYHPYPIMMIALSFASMLAASKDPRGERELPPH